MLELIQLALHQLIPRLRPARRRLRLFHRRCRNRPAYRHHLPVHRIGGRVVFARFDVVSVRIHGLYFARSPLLRLYGVSPTEEREIRINMLV